MLTVDGYPLEGCSICEDGGRLIYNQPYLEGGTSMNKHKEPEVCRIPFCKECLAEIKRVKEEADNIYGPEASMSESLDKEPQLPWITDLECPACHSTGFLFVGKGGYITCSVSDCPNPDYNNALHSHMKTAFDEVIGENEDDRWVDINGNTVQSWEDAINKESRNDLRKEQRTRAAKYLSTIQVKGGVKVEPPLKRKVNDE